MARKGRPKKKAPRNENGRLARGRAAWDYGNDRIVELESMFSPFQDGKAGQWIKTPIGRAWAVGLLDGYDADPVALRDAGLNYAARYWGYWPCGAGVTNYEREDRRGSGWGDGSDPRGLAFERLDKAVTDAGRASAAALHSLVVDCHWFPLDNPAWLDRLINVRLLSKRRTVSGVLQMPMRGDAETLKLAAQALLAIVAGIERKKAA